jgi:hypothetical protein
MWCYGSLRLFAVLIYIPPVFEWKLLILVKKNYYIMEFHLPFLQSGGVKVKVNDQVEIKQHFLIMESVQVIFNLLELRIANF